MPVVGVTAKGQVVIPARLRRKYGIKKGSKVSVSEAVEEGVIVLRPLPEDPITASRGMLKGGTSLLKALLKDRKEEAARG